MPVIPVNKVVDPKKNNWKKIKGRGGGEAQGVADPQKIVLFLIHLPRIQSYDHEFRRRRCNFFYKWAMKCVLNSQIISAIFVKIALAYVLQRKRCNCKLISGRLCSR
jgi:hypothetical protein